MNLSNPQNREAEEALLGSILIDPEVYYDVAGIVEADDFYIIRHQWIWEAVKKLHDRATPIDALTVADALGERLAEVGGPAYLTELITKTPRSSHAAAYARSVRISATRRKMLTAGSHIASLAYNEELSSEELLAGAAKATQEVFAHAISDERMKSAPEMMSDAYDRMDEIAKRQALPGVPTGFIDLDRLIPNIRPGEFGIIAGRPGQGKSSFLLSVMHHLRHQRVFMASLEMGAAEITDRLLAMESSLPLSRIRSAALDEENWAQFAHAIESGERWKITIDDTPAMTPEFLMAKAHKAAMLMGGLDLLIVDYIQIMGVPRGIMNYGNRVQEVSYLSRSLKNLARELRVPILAAAQLSRAVEQRSDKRPVLSDLRDSGSLEQDADIVTFIYRPDEKTDVVRLLVAKQRQGPTGEISLTWRGALTKFENIANHYKETT